jgi:azurin
MKTKQILLSTLLLLTITTGLRAEPGAKTVEISAGDTMKYSVTKIEAQPGQKITVVLTNEGNLPKEAMGHNWVLLNEGVNPAAYANLAVSAKAENYQPKSLAGKVLASIPTLGPKESGKVTFTAPTTPGTYHYLCSFPAHFSAGMAGELIVK